MLIEDQAQIDLKPGMHFYGARRPLTQVLLPMQLPEDDEEFLNRKGFSWTLLPDGGGACLVLDSTSCQKRSHRSESM